jgi:PIN domain nuclease of toxin-antitoxin system
MKVLLDTHTVIWFYAGHERLEQKPKQIIENTNTVCFLSLASIWEMAIKIKLGKMNLGVSLERFIEDITENGIQILPVEVEHILKTQDMAFHHRDPFDRLIFCQAIVENMVLVSADEVADLYFANESVKQIW